MRRDLGFVQRRALLLRIGWMFFLCTLSLAGAACGNKRAGSGNAGQPRDPTKGEVIWDCTTGRRVNVNVNVTGTGCSRFDALMDAYSKADTSCTGENDPKCSGKCSEDQREWPCRGGAVNAGEQTKTDVTEKEDKSCPNGFRYTATFTGVMECKCGCWTKG